MCGSYRCCAAFADYRFIACPSNRPTATGLAPQHSRHHAAPRRFNLAPSLHPYKVAILGTRHISARSSPRWPETLGKRFTASPHLCPALLPSLPSRPPCVLIQVTNLANTSSLVYHSLLSYPAFGDGPSSVNWCGELSP